jgi:hypothetical protein
MLCVVIGKLRMRKQTRPIILIVVNKTVQILLENLIHTLSLPIRLWMSRR